MLEGYAEYYSADLSEKVVRGMTETALKGIYNGGTIPFGYIIDETRHYQPDPLLAPYVEQTFQKYADGVTTTDLRDWLKVHNCAAQTRTCRGETPPSCCARPFCRLKAPLGLSLLRCAAQTRTFENTLLSAACEKIQEKLWQKKRGLDGASPLDKEKHG